MFGSILERQFDRSNSEILGIALYIEGLLKLLQFRVKDMKSGIKALPLYLPQSIRSKIFTSFTDQRYVNPLDQVPPHFPLSLSFTHSAASLLSCVTGASATSLFLHLRYATIRSS